MKPRVTFRSQADHFDQDSLVAVVDCSNDEPITRQEFKDDSDINSLLSRYGALPPSSRPAVFQDIDYTQDLLSSYEALSRAETLFEGLSPQVQQFFGSWANLAQALADGTANELFTKAHPPAPKPDPSTGSAGAGGSMPAAGEAVPAGATSNPAPAP